MSTRATTIATWLVCGLVSVLASAGFITASAGLITANGPVHSSSSSSSSSSSGGGTSARAWDSQAADFYVDPEKTSNGTGTFGNPYQPNQVLAQNGTGGTAVTHSGSTIVIEWLPGTLSYTDTRDGAFDDLRSGYWRAVVGGTSGNPIVHRAQYPAGDPDTDSGDYTTISRAGGMGSIFGVGSPGGAAISDVVLQGFNLPTWAGSAGSESEVFIYAVWDASRVHLRWSRLDGQSAGAISEASNNYGAIWHQGTTSCEVYDNLIQNIGSTSGTQIWSGAEHYSANGLQIYNNDFINIRGQGIFEKGETSFANSGNRYYRNKFVDIIGANPALFVYNHTTDATLANATWIYQNLVIDSTQGYRSQTNEGTQSGVVFVNNTIVRPQGFTDGRVAAAMQFGGHEHDPVHVVRNNVFYQGLYSYLPGDGDSWATNNDQMDVDRNRHYQQTNGIMNNSGNRNLAYVQGTLGVDVNGQESNPGFYDTGSADDYRRTFDELGTDYLQLLGGLTSAAINQGAYILADQSDQIGRRF